MSMRMPGMQCPQGMDGYLYQVARQGKIATMLTLPSGTLKNAPRFYRP